MRIFVTIGFGIGSRRICIDDVAPSDTIERVKCMIEMHEEGGIPRLGQRLSLPPSSLELEDDKTLAKYNIQNEAELLLRPLKPPYKPPRNHLLPYTIYVHPTNGGSVPLEVESSATTIAALKVLIEDKKYGGIPRDKQRLFWGSHALGPEEDEKTLDDFQIRHGHCLKLDGYGLWQNVEEKVKVKKRERKRKRKRLKESSNIDVFLRFRHILKKPKDPLRYPTFPKLPKDISHEKFWKMKVKFLNQKRKWLKKFEHVHYEGYYNITRAFALIDEDVTCVRRKHFSKLKYKDIVQFFLDKYNETLSCDKHHLHLLRPLEINYVFRGTLTRYFITTWAKNSRNKKRYRAQVAVCLNGCKFLEGFGVPRPKDYQERCEAKVQKPKRCSSDSDSEDSETMSDGEYKAYTRKLEYMKMKAKSRYEMTYFTPEKCNHII